MPNIDIISPNGELGSIPEEQKEAALASGYKLPNNTIPTAPIQSDQIDVLSPDFKLGSIPKSQLAAAKSQGYLEPNDPGYDYGLKVKNNIDLIDKGGKSADDILSKPITTFQEKQADGSFKNVELNPSEAAEKIAKGTVRLADENDRAALEALLKVKSDSILNKLKEFPARFVSGGEKGAAKLQVLGSLILTFGGKLLDEETKKKLEEAPNKIAEDTRELYSGSNSDKSIKNIGSKTSLATPGLTDILAEQIPGFAAGGAVGKLAKAGLGLAGIAETGIAAKTAIVAAEMAPQAMVQAAVDKDPKGAIETFALGIGLGAGLGLLGKGLGYVAESTSKEAQAAMRLTRIDQGLEAFGVKIEGMTAEAKQAAIDAIAAKGIKSEESVAAISRGENLGPLVSKLDQYEKVPATDLSNKIISLEERATSSIDKEYLSKAVKEFEKVSDSSGNISLPKLLEFVDKSGKSLTSEEILSNSIKNEVYNIAKQELLTAGQKAAVNDAKLLDQWNKEVTTLNIADQINTKLIGDSGKVIENDSTISNLLKKGISKLDSNLEHIVAIKGAMIGGSVLPIVGHVIGYEGSKSIYKLAKSYISNAGENGSKLTSFINKNINNSSLPSYLLLDFIHSTANKVKQIEPFLKDIGKTSIVFSNIKDPISHTLGDHSIGLSKEQQFNKLADQLAKLQNPEVRQAHINDLVSPFVKDHPALADAMAKDYDNKIQYLHQIMPKNSNPPKAFQKQEKFIPSKTDMDEFSEQLKIANNPFALLDNLKKGTITTKQVATAAILNPAILNHIRDELNNIAYSGKIDLNYKQRLNASIIMGTAMDQSLNNVQQLQSVYATAQPQNSQPVKKATKGGNKIKNSDLPSTLTTSQRVNNK